MSCYTYIHGYTFYLFLFSRKWKHQTLNQYLNVFLMGSIKFFLLFLFLFISYIIPFSFFSDSIRASLSFLSSSNRALLSSISSRFRCSSCCLNVLASIFSLCLHPSGHLFASLPSQSEPCLVGVLPSSIPSVSTRCSSCD